MTAPQGSPEALVKNGLLARRGMTWEVTGLPLVNLENAVNGAIALLRSVSGNKALSFTRDDDLDLAITCAWYLAENRRADFMHDYNAELNWLRAREALIDGTDEETGVSCGCL